MFHLRTPSFYVAMAICLASCAWSSISEARGDQALRAGQANPLPWKARSIPSTRINSL